MASYKSTDRYRDGLQNNGGRETVSVIHGKAPLPPPERA